MIVVMIEMVMNAVSIMNFNDKRGAVIVLNKLLMCVCLFVI